MNRTLLRILASISALLLLGFVVLVINQTAQVVTLAGTLHPRFGQVVLWTLVVAYAGLLAVPAVLFWRLPRQLAPPPAKDSPEFAAYLAAVRDRLAANPHLSGVSLASEEDLVSALATLDARANQIACETASTVFLTTAVSQSGRLDGLVVLAAQSRMVWQIAHVYYQRPSPRDFLRLYANVASTAFVAAELDDVDVSQQIEPILGATGGAVLGAVPGMQGVATVVVSSVLTGSANAFLTLRVGMIAKRYCHALVQPDRRVLRRLAVAEAAGLLGSIVAAGSARVARGFTTAASRTVGGAMNSAKTSVVAASSAATAKVSQAVLDVGASLRNAGRSAAERAGLGRAQAVPGAEAIAGSTETLDSDAAQRAD